MLKALGIIFLALIILSFLGCGGVGLFGGIIGGIVGIIGAIFGAVLGLIGGIVGALMGVFGVILGLLLPVLAIVLIVGGIVKVFSAL